ncbi:transposase [Xanthomonas oryzae pv. oryzicola]|nr:transposase [Xanthomonas oryzae pv. oryzicola]
MIEGSGRSRCEAENARWVNVLLSNLKRSLDGAYHAFKFAPRNHGDVIANSQWGQVSL